MTSILGLAFFVVQMYLGFEAILADPSVMQEFVWRSGTEIEINCCMSNSRNKVLFKHYLVLFLPLRGASTRFERF